MFLKKHKKSITISTGFIVIVGLGLFKQFCTYSFEYAIRPKPTETTEDKFKTKIMIWGFYSFAKMKEADTLINHFNLRTGDSEKLEHFIAYVLRPHLGSFTRTIDNTKKEIMEVLYEKGTVILKKQK